MTVPVQQMRIAVTLPSAASLGAYQSGAVAALLVAVQRLNERADAAGRPAPVVVDAVGAASAGALAGLLATRCLLAGLDPVHVLHRAWVREASWRRLRRGARYAPLSLAEVERSLPQLLDPRDRRGRPAHRAPQGARQHDPVVLHLDFGSLEALSFPIPGSGPTIEALTHVDASEFVLGPGDDGVEAWTGPAGRSPLDVMLASMSHPAVFAPRLLDRRQDRERYRERGITNVPASGSLWCADGGALLRNPLAGTLSAGRRAEQQRRQPLDAAHDLRVTRVHLLVHPHTADPAHDDRWTDPAHRPRWTSSLARAVASLAPESLYADQRRIEDVNVRLQWRDELVSALAPLLPPEAGPALTRLLERMPDEAPRPDDQGAGGDVRSVLSAAVSATAGLSGKSVVRTEAISPLRLLDAPGSPARQEAAQQEQVPSLLAGEFLGRFGGLLDRRVRDSDFVTGWRSTRVWLAEALTRHGVGAADVDEALAAVDARRVEHRRAGRWGGARLSDLAPVAWARLAGTALHTVRVVVAESVRSKR